MIFFDKLRMHCGGLIMLKTQLYWCNGRGWDNTPGRVCIILDVVDPLCDDSGKLLNATFVHTGVGKIRPTAINLLIDGSPIWAMVVDKDVQFV
jgi:hypothetical protein